MDSVDDALTSGWIRFIPGPVLTAGCFILSVSLYLLFYVIFVVFTAALLVIVGALASRFPQFGVPIWVVVAVGAAVIIRQLVPANPAEEAEDDVNTIAKFMGLLAVLGKWAGENPRKYGAIVDGYFLGMLAGFPFLFPLILLVILLVYVVAFSQIACYWWLNYGGFAVNFSGRTSSVFYFLQYGVSWLASAFNISQAFGLSISDIRATTLVTRALVIGLNVVLVFVVVTAFKKAALVIPETVKLIWKRMRAEGAKTQSADQRAIQS